MNYRHAYHAGNHTEVFKHAVLVALLGWLRRKDTPFMVLDTHAGLGVYDLRSTEAEKTGEAADGIGTVIDKPLIEAKPYLSLVAPFLERGEYPGSPSIISAMLREQDRLVACELHPDDASILRRNFRGDGRVAIHRRDGYEAIPAFVPPPERRGLVFIDPPFEDRTEACILGRALAAAARKWTTGCYLAWYPVKGKQVGAAISGTLVENGTQNCLRAEFLRYPQDGTRLAGGGLIVINPPWRFDEFLGRLGPELLDAFAAHGGRSTVRWLTRMN